MKNVAKSIVRKFKKLNSADFALSGDINRLMVPSHEFSTAVHEFANNYTRNFTQFFGVGSLDESQKIISTNIKPTRIFQPFFV